MTNFQDQFHALGSEVALTLVSGQQAQAASLFAELRSEIDAFEQRFSRFLPDSELTHVNRTAGRRTAVSPEFHALITAALHYAHLTDGLFNPLVLPGLQRAGYRSSWPAPGAPSSAPLYLEGIVTSVDQVQLSPGHITLPEGAAIDFGGIGKGYLLDRLATRVPKQFAGYWFSLGGDIAAGGRDQDGNPWAISAAGAYQDDVAAGYFVIADAPGAVATSGVTKRRGAQDGRPWHHIIDPRTSEPADTNLATVTVVAPGAALADVLAKCAVIAGAHSAWDFASRRGATGAILQTASGGVIKAGEAA